MARTRARLDSSTDNSETSQFTQQMPFSCRDQSLSGEWLLDMTVLLVQIRRLEVERKFLVTPITVSYLRSNSGGSRFKKHESLGKQTTQDTYYDRNGLLFSKGVYICRRNGHWEAKIRTDGNFINSAFTEVDGNNAVKEVIEQNLTISTGGLSIEEMLEPYANFLTERES
ncbi:hypothetical protein F5882DRAFT_513192 [Hyaloscypha sp. PMI_1271]|nr:hypothetical protein F5882DRAFT_513192 [Hyaloscypha sp. PMI_1271]